ncbi:hypothetical protein SCUP515_08329 [Seiridium cupressi]
MAFTEARIAELQRLLEESEKRASEEQRRREEEQRRRKEAEELAKESRLQLLVQYLEACHSLSLAIQVDDFAASQESIWERLTGGSFSSQPIFPTTNQIAYVTSLIHPINSELGLRDFERDTVENAVRDISFKSHTNLGNGVNTVSQSLKNASISENSTGAMLAAPKTRRRARGKGNRADQFCIYRNKHGQNMPAIAIEYKPPHKLAREEIVVGLRSEIQPQRNVIHKTVPNLDVFEDDPAQLHHTAVAQVFAFILQAVRVEPPPQSWHDAAADLDTWAIKFDNVLREIPPTVRKERPTSAYKP